MGEPSVGTARQYRGDSTEVCTSSSPWFCSEDIPSDSWDRFVVQIEDVFERRGVKFFQGKSRPSELTLKFAGIEKELVLNITNRRVIDAMFTPAVSNWIGKWVTLYVQKGIPTKGGELKNGIRFRDDGPKGARPPVQHAPPPVAPKPAAKTPPAAPEPSPAAEPASTAAGATAADTAPGGVNEPDVWRRDVLANLAEFRKVAPPAEFDALKARAGIAGKTPAQLTAEDIDRINEALPAPFHVAF